jgi:hypothetical protein
MTRHTLALGTAMTLLAVTVAASNVSAQVERATSLEVRGIAMLPTFDIADAANLGWGGGVGIGYRVSPKVRLMADVDVAIHDTDVTDFQINTYHYMGKVGYDVVDNGKVVVTLNLGAGAVTFGGDLPESKTYFAINAGAKVGIRLSPSLEFLISPQGDIAFTKEADLGTTNSWVWPLGVGLRAKF